MDHRWWIEPRKYLMRVVILGKDCAGKSSLLLSYERRIFWKLLTYNWNWLVSFIKKARSIESEGKLINFKLLNTKEHSMFYIKELLYVKGANGIIIVIDLTNPEALDAAASWKSKFNSKYPENKKPTLLVGSKADLEHERVITYDEAKKVADELNIMYIEASVKTRKNVDKVFEILIRSIWRSEFYI